MLLQQLKQRRLSCCDVQLIIAIALDELDYKDASVIVSEQLLSISDAELDARFRDDPISGMLDYFLTENIFPVSTGKLNKGREFVNLVQLCPGINVAELTAVACRIACITSRSGLICLFYRTTKAVAAFYKHVTASKRYSYDGRKNTLPSDVLNTIYNGFMEFFDRNCRNSYNTASRSPIAFMYHCYDSFYNRENSQTKINPVNEIINIKSLDSPIGNSENTTALIDYVELEENDFSGDSIDFNDLATKIYKASNYLFNNRNEKKAFYDIFSWYRDFIFLNQVKENTTLRSLNNNTKVFGRFKFDIRKEIDNFDSTTRNKYNARDAVCKAFLPLLHGSISTEEIFDLYQRVVKSSVEVLAAIPKDGTAHYSDGNVNARKTGKNCDKFRAEFEGFLALRDLLEFINSSKNTLGVTIFNMPTDVFRDPLLLKRFHSFKQYILMHRDVKYLMNQVQNDPTRNQLVYKGINSNDRVYDFLVNMPARHEHLMNTIFRMSLASAEDRLCPETSAAGRLRNNIEKVSSYLKQLKISVLDEYKYGYYVAKDDPKALAAELVKVSAYLYKNSKKDGTEDAIKASEKFIYAIRYKNIAKALFHLLGTEIVDEDGFYSLQYALCVELNRICDTEQLFELLHPLGFETKACEAFINFAYGYLCKFLFDAGEVDTLNLLTIRDFFFTLDLIEAVIVGFDNLMEHIRGTLSDLNGSVFVTDNNLFLVYAELISHYPILNLKPCISKIADIIFLVDGNNVQPYYLHNTDTTIGEEYFNREKNVVKGVNRYLSLCKSEFKFLTGLKGDIYKTLGRETASVIEDKALLEKLAEVNYNIITGNQYTRDEIAQAMESQFNFNEMGFVVQLDTIFKYNQDGFLCFYHKYGYKVVFSDLMIDPDIKKLTAIDVDNLKLYLGV